MQDEKKRALESVFSQIEKQFGAGAVMRDGTSVGEWTTVGCGAAVVKNLDPNSVYVGCPAKLLRRNNE